MGSVAAGVGVSIAEAGTVFAGSVAWAIWPLRPKPRIGQSADAATAATPAVDIIVTIAAAANALLRVIAIW